MPHSLRTLHTNQKTHTMGKIPSENGISNDTEEFTVYNYSKKIKIK